jgi:hypothetical protein
MTFKCCYDNQNWSGEIVKVCDYGSHYEIRIESRSGITVLFGQTSMGNFACMPDFNSGCHLAEFNNEYFNKEKLSYAINPIDGITVTKGLKTFAEKNIHS